MGTREVAQSTASISLHQMTTFVSHPDFLGSTWLPACLFVQSSICLSTLLLSHPPTHPPTPQPTAHPPARAPIHPAKSYWGLLLGKCRGRHRQKREEGLSRRVACVLDMGTGKQVAPEVR